MKFRGTNISGKFEVKKSKKNSGRLSSGKWYPAVGLLCATGDQILCGVIRRDLASNACRSVARERPRSENKNKMTQTLTCTHARRYAFP